MLSLKNVTKRFKSLTAVDNVTFDIEEGSVIGLVGPNGAGKTTLFNMVNGIYKATEGEIFYKGEEITGKTPYEICRLGIGRSYQNPRPFHSLNLFENCFVSALYGGNLDQNKARKKVIDVLKLIGLYEKRNVFPDEIGVVDLKRLELARGLSTSPDLLLIDEIAGGLTLEEIERVQELIKSINREMGVTIFLVEHVIPMVVETADRLMVMDEGKKIAEGKPEECFEKEEVIRSYLGG